MAVEIGQLILRGTFGSERPDRAALAEQEELRATIEALRQDILAEMQDMIRDASRRQWER